VKPALAPAIVATLPLSRLVLHANGNVDSAMYLNWPCRMPTEAWEIRQVRVEMMRSNAVAFAEAVILDTLWPGLVEHWDRIARSRSIDAATKGALASCRDSIVSAIASMSDDQVLTFRLSVMSSDYRTASDIAKAIEE